MSQFFNIGLSFYFIECRRWKLGKNTKITKVTVFWHKIKTKASTKNLRHDGTLRDMLLRKPPSNWSNVS